MKFVLLNYWGYSNPLSPSMERKANHSLKMLAIGLVKRLPICISLPTTRTAFKRYFIAYYRSSHNKTLKYMFTPDVRMHVWSYALYIALEIGYDIDELEYLWKTHIGEKNGIEEVK